MNYAYVTLLSSMDYIPPVLALDKNLKEIKSKFPLYVMVTENIYDNAIKYLNKEYINAIKVPVIQYSKATIELTKDKRMLSIASKLNIFTLHQFEKVVYLDADCMILKNIDKLFNFPDGAMYDEGNAEQGFVGLFVCCPSAHALNYYLAILQNSSTSMWESDLLEPLWFPFKTNIDYRIPPFYFVNFTMTGLEDFNQNFPIYGIHFCYKYKPWNYFSVDNFLNDYTKELLDYGNIRKIIVDEYISKYILPLRKKYPEIFK